MRHEKSLLPIGALILIVIGGLWLSQDMGWISSEISWWPVLLIVIGVGVLVNNWYK